MNFYKNTIETTKQSTGFFPISKKRRKHMLTPLFVFILLLLALCSTWFSSESQENLLVLWNTTLPAETAQHKLSMLSDKLILSEHTGDFSICRTTGKTSTKKLLALLSSSEDILLAEQDQPLTLTTTVPPNDTFFNTQWAFDNTGLYSYYIGAISILRNATKDIDMNLLEAWQSFPKTATQKPVIVAIIDTGVDIHHPELAGHIWKNPKELPNGLDDDGNGYTDDYNGWDFYNNDATVVHSVIGEDGSYMADPNDSDNHGTLCAGIIAASSNNEAGIAGVASNANVQILPLKIHGGIKGSGSVSNAIKAVKYATAVGADICNMSWGTTTYSETLEHVMRESDMLFIAAAGNNGRNNNSTPMYPACYALDNLISVAYIDPRGNLAFDSNYGVSTVDIAAPGADIYSTIVGGSYAYANGTSMAAPHISGIAALLYAMGDNVYPANVKEIIVNNLKPLDNLNGHIRYPGIPDVSKIVAAADTLITDITAPTIQATSFFRQDTLVLETRSEDLGGSGIRVIKYAPGERSMDYFAHGTIGTSMPTQMADVSKAGIYTFYISDYAGNETISVYEATEDTQPPILSATYTVSETDGTLLVTIQASDMQSGIKTLRYLPGTHSIDSFLAAGTDLPLHGNTASFVADTTGLYSICAIDYRGNKTMLALNVELYPAVGIMLNITNRSLLTEKTFSLLPVLFPLHSTDTVHYVSSDEAVLTVSKDGLVTAHAPGMATVTVTAKSGVSTSCTFIVQEAVLPIEEIPEEEPEEQSEEQQPTSDSDT